ncbi:NUDIX hydrolase [Streptomyces meridianus]|uniref:NUDIX domain-containing protein n=1 Tax=Streptomyces meridianus TaxID=2938945 RepID=A0ABT0X3M5_9ACTN|nr:NUDIX domain-containing protein [Streptomyces meridianus]MCM2576830.1 NUDIX domain-containing protein [Streptomyces meridianus]
MTTPGASHDTDRSFRRRLMDLVEGISPWDDQERGHVAVVAEWITRGSPLHRVRKPDVPDQHLVCYFVVLDEAHEQLLLVAHRKAGLWLPSGGHVEPGEEPWDTVVRECREELRIGARPSALSGTRPFFLTVTRTRGAGEHTDVSLWYLLQADPDDITSFDSGEFETVRWFPLRQVLTTPVDTLDPHMHRFTRKLLAAVPTG